ncbi:transposase [Methanospirillum stamsii]
MTLNQSRLFRTLKTLDIFVDRALNIEYPAKGLSGFQYNRDLLKAAVANSYLETVGNRADSIHLAIKRVKTSDIVWAYRDTVQTVGSRFGLKDKNVVLAFDYTDEDFYGEINTLWIHGYTGEHGVKGKFKFLSCSIINSDIPEKIPLISIPVMQGHCMAQMVAWCFTIIKPLINSVILSIYDRGFYSKDLMLTLTHASLPYLIFVKKDSKIKKELESLKESERKKITYCFKLNKDMTVIKGETTLALLKQIFDKKSQKSFDWAFATNQEEINLDTIIPSYKRRWRIETGFRVQDEARISSKSKDMKIRYFFFAYEQVLQLLWTALYKEEAPFKQFLLEIYELANARYHEP